MANQPTTETTPTDKTPKHYGDYRDIVTQAHRGLQWVRPDSARETRNGGLRLASTAVTAGGFSIGVTAWRNVDQQNGKVTVSVSFPSYVTFDDSMSQGQQDDVKVAVLESFLKYAEDTSFDIMHATSRATLTLDETGRLVKG